MNSFRQIWVVAAKDLAVELRTKESINAAGAFAISILLIFSFAFDPTSDTTSEFGGGLLWISFAFAGALVFNRGFARELPNECLDALMASPLSASSLVMGKAAANFVMLWVVELVSLFVFGLFYNTNWTSHLLALVAVMALGTWGISVLGSVFGALTVNLKLRELMLPVIIYPLMIPLLIGSIEFTNSSLGKAPIPAANWMWMKLLLVYDVVFTALSVMLADTILVN